MEQEYIKPEFQKDSFHCPKCNVFAHQIWTKVSRSLGSGHLIINSLVVAYCAHCKNYSVWQEEKMVYPKLSTAPMAGKDMPEEVRKIYEEARDVAGVSARAAAALLRVALEKPNYLSGRKRGKVKYQN